MRTFTDTKGRQWNVVLNVDAMKRVRGQTELDLLESFRDPAALDRLSADPVLLCAVVYSLCQVEAEAAGITPEDFGRAMSGDVLDAAINALLEELVDFFPTRRRTVLRKVLDKSRALSDLTLTAAEQKLDSLDLEKLAGDLVRSGEPSTNSPASPV